MTQQDEMHSIVAWYAMLESHGQATGHLTKGNPSEQ